MISRRRIMGWCRVVPKMYILLITVAWIGPLGVQSIGPYLLGNHQTGGREVPVELHISGDSGEQLIYNLSSSFNVVTARNKLKSIHPVNTEGVMKLVIDGTVINLITHPILLHRDFFVKVRSAHNSHTVNLNDSANHGYDPFCMVSAKNKTFEASFNLCEGINGYYHHGEKKYTIHSEIGETIQHFIQSEQIKSRFPPGEDPKPFLRHMDMGERKRRHATLPYYLETYIVADFDYYDNKCWWAILNPSHCHNVVFVSMYLPSQVLRLHFELAIVIVGIEIWYQGNKVDIPQNRTGSYDNITNKYLYKQFPDYGEIVRNHTLFDAFLYLSQTQCIDNDIYGIALFNGACQRPNSYAYVDACATHDRNTLTILHEITHLIGSNHVMGHECLCTPHHCIMAYVSVDPDDAVYSNCTLKVVKETLPTKTCLHNEPKYNVKYGRCGDGVIDPGEDCEPHYGWACCTPYCKLRGECANGQCCDIRRCQLIQDNRICRQTKGYCDFQERCDGVSPFCPSDKRRADGHPCLKQGRSFCKDGLCNTVNAACNRIYEDKTAKASRGWCWEQLALDTKYKDADIYSGDFGGDIFCESLSCDTTSYVKPSEFGQLREQFRVFWPNAKAVICPYIEGIREGEVYRPEETYSGTYWYLTEGARCGPAHYCADTKCVRVPTLPDKCKNCTGFMSGCDQNFTCRCDVDIHYHYCSYSVSSPPDPGGEGWEDDIGKDRRDPPTGDPRIALEDGTGSGRLATILVPIAIILVALIALAVFVLRGR